MSALYPQDLPLILKTLAALLVGCTLTYHVNPDLDLSTLTASEYKMMKYLGPVGFAWLWFWFPYSKAFKHRSRYTHLPILSTLIRILYFLLRLLYIDLAIFVLNKFFLLTIPYISNLLLKETDTVVFVILIVSLPLLLNDFIHWLRDGKPR